MTDAQFSATIQRVLEYLQYNAGTPITAGDLCTMLDCTPADARTASTRSPGSDASNASSRSTARSPTSPTATWSRSSQGLNCKIESG